MFELAQSPNQIIIKRDTTLVGFGIFALAMEIPVVPTLFDWLPFEEGDTFMDVFGLIFMCIWIGVVSCMAIACFSIAGKQTRIDRDGILCVTWFGKRSIKWSDVKDWGLSYCGQTKGKGNTYHLYFSDHQCPVKNDCKKKLKGKMIKTFVFGDDYFKAVRNVIPFCSENTEIAPFIGKDKDHFI